ncbi:DNA cytosine methyltransferase [Lysinibacillus tabacifolii]|uniref:Cytosine-specific methyltransferase n=1 Tax=Lysinibacillus tabacifolii TaxID=1173107 RepID=A0ABY2SUB2_9BACI|nr:DNA cytosine methyltransferase [Lysinibacillus tabacifolii]TKI46254.1 DNA cytosine methyltransferase [Lysinibacillus tabacifolii]
MPYTVGSLFAGVGGIDKGFEQAGARIIWANELDKNACTTYRANFEHELIEDNIRNIQGMDMPDVDIITAGWPCVAFSVAGNRHGMKYQCDDCKCEHSVTYEQYITQVQCPNCHGKNTAAIDERGTLFFDVIRFIRAKQPRAIFLENVKNLVGHDKGNTFKVIRQMLEESGYHIKYKVMNTMEYGNIPQNRERIFVVGFRFEDDYQRFTFPDQIPLTRTIDDILNREVQQEDKMYYTEESQYYSMLEEVARNRNTVYQIRRVYVRENQSNVCPTLTANMGTGGHNVPIIIDNWGYRKITPREALSFQGFPDDYVIPEGMANSHVYKQAGNAVSVPVVRRIATNLIASLDGINLNININQVQELEEEQEVLELI